MFQLGVITLFPEMFESLNLGVIGRAQKENLVDIKYWNPRDWSPRANRQVDDKPYGGGPGMVMMYEPLHKAIFHAKNHLPSDTKTVYVSPKGKKIVQNDLNRMINEKQSLLFVAGRYEGIDERVIESDIDEEWSLGDFVLSGGELAIMVYLDALIRLIPHCLGDEASAQNDSFVDGLLEYPHYTRPQIADNREVPNILLQGNHREINRWRRKQALGKTWLKRPDLLTQLNLDETDRQLLAEFQNEKESGVGYD